MSRVPDEQSEFEQDIYLFPPEGKLFKILGSEKRSLHVVLLDTQCTVGNWISEDLVRRLGMEEETRCIKNPPNARDYNGRPVVAGVMILFQWRHLNGTTMHGPVDFFVGNRRDIDLIFGSHYIKEKGLLTFDKDRMLPIMPYRERTRPPEQARIAAMEESQRQGKERAEDFRQSYSQQSQYPAARHESDGRSAQGSFSNQPAGHTLQRSQGYEALPARQSYAQAQSPMSPYQRNPQSSASQHTDTRNYSTYPGRFDEYESREPPYSGAHEPNVGIREPPSSHRDSYSRAHDASSITRDPYSDSREPSSGSRKPNPGSHGQRRGTR